MFVMRWKELLLATAQLLLWLRATGQPTPPPTLFEGSSYDYTQCLIDVFQSDANGDGFISNNEQEYLALLNNIGESFCFEQNAPLTATQQSAYFTLVCELVPNCLITSEIPTNGLSKEQIIKICEETRASIFTTCPEPTASPDGPTPQAPLPSPVPTPTVRLQIYQVSVWYDFDKLCSDIENLTHGSIIRRPCLRLRRLQRRSLDQSHQILHWPNVVKI